MDTVFDDPRLHREREREVEREVEVEPPGQSAETTSATPSSATPTSANSESDALAYQSQDVTVTDDEENLVRFARLWAGFKRQLGQLEKVRKGFDQLRRDGDQRITKVTREDLETIDSAINLELTVHFLSVLMGDMDDPEITRLILEVMDRLNRFCSDCVERGRSMLSNLVGHSHRGLSFAVKFSKDLFSSIQNLSPCFQAIVGAFAVAFAGLAICTIGAPVASFLVSLGFLSKAVYDEGRRRIYADPVNMAKYLATLQKKLKGARPEEVSNCLEEIKAKFDNREPIENAKLSEQLVKLAKLHPTCSERPQPRRLRERPQPAHHDVHPVQHGDQSQPVQRDVQLQPVQLGDLPQPVQRDVQLQSSPSDARSQSVQPDVRSQPSDVKSPVTNPSDQEVDSGEVCSVCQKSLIRELSNDECEEFSRPSNCSHYHHHTCLEEWFSSNSVSVCPVCKTESEPYLFSEKLQKNMMDAKIPLAKFKNRFIELEVFTWNDFSYLKLKDFENLPDTIPRRKLIDLINAVAVTKASN